MSPLRFTRTIFLTLCVTLHCGLLRSQFVFDVEEFKDTALPAFEAKCRAFANVALENANITDLFVRSRGGAGGGGGGSSSELHLDGLKKMLRELLFKVDSKYSGVTAALKSLKEEFERNLQTGSTRTLPRLQKKCCSLLGPSEGRYLGRYRDVVSVDQECVGRTENTAKELFLLQADGAFDLMKRNYENSTSILWQYLATVDGHYVQFPRKDRYCEGGNIISPLTQRWMADKLLQEKQNIVILLDAGSAMASDARPPPSGPPGPPLPLITYWDVARHAAKRLVKELTFLDRVTVVVMNGSAVSSPPGCIDHLLVATDRNADIISSFLDGVKAEGQIDLAAGFQQAYTLLRSEKSKQGRMDTNDVILFLTNGEFLTLNEKRILGAVKTGQDSLGNRVAHLVYAIKAQSYMPSLPLLARLADLNNMQLLAKDGNSDVNVTSWQPEGYPDPVGPAGHLIISPQSLGFHFSDVVAEFYKFFPHGAIGTLDRILAVSPQRDPRVGLMLTFAVPLYNGSAHSESLYGVAAVDTSMASLFDDVIHYRWRVHSYSFLVEAERGLVLVHPKLEKPYRQTDNDPVFSTMEFMEPSFTLEQRNAILAANSSLLNFTAEVQPGRSTYKTGQDFETVARVPATVLYSRLQDTDYIIVLVIFSSELSVDVSTEQDRLGFAGTALYHHQIVSNQTADGVCARAGDFRVQDKVTVKFSPDVFTEPELYMYSREPPNDVSNMVQFLTEDGPPPPTIRREALPGLLSDLRVVSSQALARLWQGNEAGGVVERFIGTPNGVFASYPGISLPNTFDDQEYDWYRESVARPGNIWVSLRRSLTSTDQRVDVATTLTSGNRTFGVVGVTVSRRSFAGLFLNTVEYCLNEDYTCHLLTDDGYLLEVLDMTPLPLSQRHLAEVYPWLANVLLQRAVMKPLWCTVLSEGRHRQAYTLGVPDDGVTHEAGVQDACRQFLLHSVRGSNLLVLVLAGRRKQGCGENSKPEEHCQVCIRPPGAALAECPSCLANPGATPSCQCPCHCEGDFDECLDSFVHMGGATFPLTPCYEEPEMPSLSNTGPDRPAPAVPPCVMKCPAFETKEDCQDTPGCVWKDTDPYPVCQADTSTTTTTSSTAGTPTGPPSNPGVTSPTAAPRPPTGAPTVVSPVTPGAPGAGTGSTTPAEGGCSGTDCTQEQTGEDSGGGALGRGAVAGIVMGVVAVLAVAGAVGYKVFRPRVFGRLKEVDLPETPETYNSAQYTSADSHLQLTRTPVTPSGISADPATTTTTGH